MKFYFLSIFSVLALFFSCSKSDNNSGSGGSSNFLSKPEAKAEFDDSNFGVYKGVFVGSTGYAVIYLNNDNSISATVVIDGERYTFTPASGQNVSRGQNTSIRLQNNNNFFTFNVQSNGSNPNITGINVFGHSGARIVLVKERSTALVKCMEGVYRGQESSGIWNGVIVDNTFRGLGRDDEGGGYFTASSGVENNGVIKNGRTSTQASFSGSFSGNNGSGTWRDDDGFDNGTWRVTRTY